MKKYFVLGLLIKLVFIFLAFHHDLIFTWERPGVFWQNYGKIGDYYPPLVYITFAILSPLYHLSNILGTWILKIPYLVADYFIFLILLSLFPKYKGKIVILWWLNPIVIHAAYAIGTIDVLSALFVTIAIYTFTKSHIFSILALGVAAAYKTIPVILLIPASLFLSADIARRLRLILLGFAIPLSLGIVFSINSGLDVINSYFPRSSTSVQFSSQISVNAAWKYSMIVFSIVSYLFLSFFLLIKKFKNKNGYADLLFIILTLVYIAVPVNSLHRYIPLIPLLIFIFLKRGYSLTLFWVLTGFLIFGYIYTWNLQWGLLVGKVPQVADFPALREWISPIVNYEKVAFLFRTLSDLMLIWLSFKSLKYIGIDFAEFHKRKMKYAQL